MNLPPFPDRPEISNLEFFLKSRLDTKVVMWPDQAIPLLGYMSHPKDEAAWLAVVQLLWSWADCAEPKSASIPDHLRQIQANWLKVADIFQHYCDLIEGRHQEARGGASIGKAVTLVSAKAKLRGTGEANLWKIWADYKDVAPVVTAAVVVCAEVNLRFRYTPPLPTGLSPTQFTPFQMTLLMPDLVVTVAKSFEAKGLTLVNETRHEPALDPDTLWRIPENTNVATLPHPIRELSQSDVDILIDRVAGNRGKANKTTPVSE